MDLNAPNRYIAELQAHRSECRLGLATIPVFVVGPADLSPEIQAKQVQRGLDFVAREFSSLLTYICEELLEVKNSGWLKEDESPVSPEDFRSRLTPRRITIFEDGTVEVGFADCGMFWGHEVVLRTDPDLKPNWADIEG